MLKGIVRMHMLHDLISSNAELCAEFNAMKEGYDFLNTLDAAPSDESVSNVITFLRQQPVRLGI